MWSNILSNISRIKRGQRTVEESYREKKHLIHKLKHKEVQKCL